MSRRVAVLGLARALRETPAQQPRQQHGGATRWLSVQPPAPLRAEETKTWPSLPPLPEDDDEESSRLGRDFFGPRRVVGRGGFSTVIAARHRIDDQEYAIKVSRSDAVDEVRALSAVGRHDNVVRYHACWFEQKKKTTTLDSDSDSDDDDARPLSGQVLCIQMELCEETLRSWLKRTTTTTTRPSGASRAATDVARGLRHIHARAYAHLDVAAANIFRRQDGSFCLGDFGLCRPRDHLFPSADGQLLYMAPERKNSSLQTDDLRKCDVFSLAVVFYELATVFHTDMERAIDLERIPERFGRQSEHQAITRLPRNNKEKKKHRLSQPLSGPPGLP
mmetsp:Transcript_195/g.716  ORF Transcript_195/g.716 Transcript_195/m.716 type:complete len:334 (+) Transcript_195:172-1173(+)